MPQHLDRDFVCIELKLSDYDITVNVLTGPMIEVTIRYDRGAFGLTE
jgi:hypothetical protein